MVGSGTGSAAAAPTAVDAPPNRLARAIASSTVTTRATTAGTTFSSISAESSTLKASAAARVLGLGEMMLPALPPPIIASRSAGTAPFVRRPTAKATGATVMTAMSTNTPTAHTTIVATATAAKANRVPKARTIASANFAAAPVLMSAPARTPDARMRRMGDIIPFAPTSMASTVSARPPPPRSPPTSAAKMSAYAGGVLRTISTMASASPATAPHVVKTGSMPYLPCQPLRSAKSMKRFQSTTVRLCPPSRR